MGQLFISKGFGVTFSVNRSQFTLFFKLGSESGLTGRGAGVNPFTASVIEILFLGG